MTSAAVSYLGDSLGMKLGRKRISLLGLRPRYTSTIITIATGVAVAIITLIAASYTSGQVRHAFFGVNYLDRQISDLTVDLRERQYQLDEMEMEVFSARAERDRLNAEADSLRESLKEMRDGLFIAFGGEMLAQTTVAAGASARDVDGAIEKLITAAEERLLLGYDGAPRPNAATDVTVSDESREQLRDELTGTKNRRVLRLFAPTNVVLGQNVEGRVEIFDSVLIYKSGAELLVRTVEKQPDAESAAAMLYSLLRTINRNAVNDGVLPDPLSGVVGSIENVEFYDAAERLAEAGASSEVSITAAADIYTEGPVQIKITVR